MNKLRILIFLLLSFSMTEFTVSQSSSKSIFSASDSESKWEFAFGFGANSVTQQYEYSDLILGEFAKPGFRVARVTSWELSRKLSSNFKLRSGILFYQKAYKTRFESGSTSSLFGYNYSIPILLQYEKSTGNLRPYAAIGIGLDRYEELGFTAISGNTLQGHGIQSTTLGAGWRMSGQIELGSHFYLFKQKFSLALLGNISKGRTFNSDYYTMEGRELIDKLGNAHSSGNSISLRLRYHIPLDGEKSVFTALNRTDYFKDEEQKSDGKNEVGVQLSSISALYSVYYERTLLKKQSWWLSFKQEFSYIPGIDGGGYIVYNDPQAVKSEGVYIPSSLLVYLGKSKNFMVGYKQFLHFGPYANPQPDGSTHKLSYLGTAVLGLKFRVKRFTFNAQLNPIVSQYTGKWQLYYGIGIGGGYRF